MTSFKPLAFFSPAGMLLAWMVFAFPLFCESENAEVWPLLVETPAEHELSAGVVHTYRAHFNAGQSWRVEVEQRGIDVTVEVMTPGGELLGPVDSPLDRQGTEFLLIQAEAEGSYLISVYAHETRAPLGLYEIRLQAVDNPAHLDAEEARTEAARLYAKNQRREALTTYRESLLHWRAVGGKREATRELYCVAVLERLVSETDLALLSAEQALLGWQELGDQYWEAAALNEVGLNYRSLDETNEAREFFNRALHLWQAIGDQRGVVTVRNNLCLTFLAAGALRQGLACFEPIFDDLNHLAEPQLEATILLNVAWTYNRLGEPDPALEQYRQALALMQEADNRKGEAQILNNLGELHTALGQSEQALRSYEVALEGFRELDDIRWQATVLNNIGHHYVVLAEPQRALAFLREALHLRRTVMHRSGEVTTLNNLGQVYSRLGDHQRALTLHSQARQLAKELGRPLKEAVALTRLTKAELAMGAPRKALENAEPALELLQARGARSNEAEVLHLIGRARTLLGEPQQALPSLRQALALSREVQHPSGEIRTLTALAQAERDLGRSTQAKDHLESALRLIETLRVRVENVDLRASAQSSRRAIYDSYIDLLMELHRSDPSAGYDFAALESSERARARSLLDLLNEAPGALSQGAAPELLEQRAALIRRLNAKSLRQTALFSRELSPQQAVAELDFATVLHELDRVEAKIRENSPHFAALTQPQPLDAPSIQRLLDPDTVLLEYALGEKNSFLWFVTTKALHSFELPARAQIEALTRRVHNALSTPNARLRKEETKEAAALSQILLGPVAERLGNQRLMVVADGALHYLPFAALPQPTVGDVTHGGPTLPLLEQHEIVHLPSASVLAVLRRELVGRKPAAKWLLAVADPVFDRQDARMQGPGRPAPQATIQTKMLPASVPALERSSQQGAPVHFKRLPGSRREAMSITALAPPDQALALLGFEASRTAVLGKQLRDYRIVHFATHGMINANTPRLSGLVLSLFDEHQQPQEGFLRLHDLYDLQLHADLVVLSGCQTALGKEIRGEGLVGLTRGFMHAKVPRVVASLWQVEDQATAELMTRFYRSIFSDGLRPAAALRAAQRSIRRERRWKDPYYWSAFVLLGEWRLGIDLQE